MNIYSKKMLFIQSIYIAIYLMILFIFNVFKINISLTYVSVIYLLIVLLITKYMYGFMKVKSLYTKDIFIYSLIDILSYFIIIYFIGFKISFLRNPYNLSLLSIIKNMLPYFLIIVFEEFIRYMMIKKSGKSSINFFGTIIFMSVLNSLVFISGYKVSNVVSLFNYIAEIVIPSFFINILFGYLNKKVDVGIGIFFRSLLELYIFVIPIYPNFNSLLLSISKSILLIVLLFQSLNLMDREKKHVSKKEESKDLIFSYSLLVVAFLFSCLVSRLFPIAMVSIGSNSMYPYISKGDAVIYKKVDANDLEIGDVLLFNHDGLVIVHRIVDIVEINGKLVFYTKGDNNMQEDGWQIRESQIVGKQIMTVDYIGWPSVWLSERIKG